MSSISRGIKNASYLAIGNLITQFISFIGFIFIARMLGPDNYGIYVTVGSFVGLFEILLLRGLNKTIIREGSKDISSMHTFLKKTIGMRNLLIITAIIVCIIFSFFTPYELQTKLYIILFSFQLAYTGLKGFLATIYQATEKMQYISIFGIINRVIFVSLSIAFLYRGFGVLALFLIALFSNLLTISANYFYSRRYVRFNFFSKLQFDNNLLKPTIIFSLLGFAIFLTTKIDLVMISLLGTAKDVGIYGVAFKISQLGIMLRNVIAMAFFPIFIKQFHTHKMKAKQLIKYSVFFLILIFVLSLVVSFFVEDIVSILLGSEYHNSGEILRVLIFYLAFSWSTLPFTTAAQATQNEKYMLIIWSIMAALNIPLNYLLFIKYGLIGIAYSTLVVTAAGLFLISYITLKVMKKQGYLV